ncbi:MAG: hypothetical protein QMD14_05405 [Candidatus Aenigmarchaeota archaeon]|nr:hypothetical protein [Candidatus Aenigmarchaeota archaeon]
MPKKFTRKQIEKLVKLVDEEGLSFEEAGRRVGVCRVTASKLYKQRKKELDLAELKKEGAGLQGYELATIHELLSYCKQHKITILDLAQHVYDCKLNKLSIFEAKRGAEIFKILRDTGCEGDLKYALSKLTKFGGKFRDLDKIFIEKSKALELTNSRTEEVSKILQAEEQKLAAIKKEIQELGIKKLEMLQKIIQEGKEEWERIKAQEEEKLFRKKKLVESQLEAKRRELELLEREIKQLEEKVRASEGRLMLDPETAVELLSQVRDDIRAVINNNVIREYSLGSERGMLFVLAARSEFSKLVSIYDQRVIKPLEEIEQELGVAIEKISKFIEEKTSPPAAT